MASLITKLLLLFFIWYSMICLSSSVSSEYSILGQNPEEEEVLGVFQLWKKEQGREYQNPEEETKRFEIFKTNLKNIRETNAKRKSPYSYRLGLNKFADLSSEEFSEIFLHETTEITNENRGNMQMENDSCENAPASLDWRKKGAVTKVKNQEQCAGCWAFSATGAMEGINAIVTERRVSLSEQELVDCVKKSHGCIGGWSYHAFEWVVNNGGIAKEADYLYTGEKGTCNANLINKKAVTITGYKNVTISENSIFCATVKQPVSVALDGKDFQFYDGGIFDGGSCSSPFKINHAVLIVGYDSVGGEDYWIVKNSWGEDWGIKGYIYIKRNTGNAIGVRAINCFASYPTKKNSPTPTPSLVPWATI